MMVAHAPRHAIEPRQPPRPWRRQRRRRWARANDLASAPALFAAIPSLPRHELTRLTAAMIDRMDEIDGDPDLEPAREDLEDSHDAEQETFHE